MFPAKRTARGCIFLLSAMVISVRHTFTVYHPVCDVSLASSGGIFKFNVCFDAVFLDVFATVG